MRRIAQTIVMGVLATSAAAQAEQIAGAVNPNGKPQVTSAQYKVTHPSIGRYVITFTTAFPTPYATCIYMPIGNYYPSGLVETTKTCDVTFVNSSGNLANTLFNFLAVNTTK